MDKNEKMRLDIAMQTEQYNGFGLEWESTTKTAVVAEIFVVCDEPALQVYLRTVLKLATLGVHSCLGHVFVTLGIYELEHIPRTMEAMANLGFMPKLKTWLGQSMKRNEKFDIARLEHSMIHFFQEHSNIADEMFGHRAAKPWNYRTREGVAFCFKMRRKLSMGDPTDAEFNRFTDSEFMEICGTHRIYVYSAWYGNGYSPSDSMGYYQELALASDSASAGPAP